MDKPTLRLLIQQRLADGRVPYDSIPSVWGGPGNGETCDACGETVTKAQMLMESRDARARGRRVQFHVACFYLWDVERQVPRHGTVGPARSASPAVFSSRHT